MSWGVFSLFSVGIFIFLTSCSTSPQQGFNNEINPPPVERVQPKRPDPVKQGECLRRGRSNCEGNRDCEDICDDIFSRRADREDCYEYSSEMIFEFERLIEVTEDGDVEEIEDIGPNVLECMLDIDEREFAKAIRGMSRREAKEFVFLIAENEDFAEVLEDEDDEFNILKQILHSATGSSDLERALSQEIEDDKTFLWLAAEYNESAWKWLDDYVGEECDGRDTSDCPGGENIGAYCNALQESGFSKNDWEDFLSDTRLFADDYEEEVEDKKYEYEITNSPGRGYSGDFRDYCYELSGGSGDCPSSDPPANLKLAEITFYHPIIEGRWNYRGYIGPNYRTDWSIPEANRQDIPYDPDNRGDSDPSQDVLLKFAKRAVLDGDMIRYDERKTYYIYFDGERLELENEGSREYGVHQSYREDRIWHLKFNIKQGRSSYSEAYTESGQSYVNIPESLTNNGPYTIYIASELNNHCVFHR